MPQDDGEIIKALSIKTIYADQIRDRTKTFELRTYCPGVKPNGWLALYETKPTAAIQTVLQIGRTFKLHPDEAWELYSDRLGINIDDYFLYFRKREFAYGMEVINVRSFDLIPLAELRETIDFKVPQMCMTLKSVHKRIYCGINWV